MSSNELVEILEDIQIVQRRSSKVKRMTISNNSQRNSSSRRMKFSSESAKNRTKYVVPSEGQIKSPMKLQKDLSVSMSSSESISDEEIPYVEHIGSSGHRWGQKVYIKEHQMCKGDSMVQSYASEMPNLHNELPAGVVHNEAADVDVSSEDEGTNDYERQVQKYEKYYERNPFTDPYYVVLVDLHGLDRIRYELQKYNDGHPLLGLRKWLTYLSVLIPVACRTIVISMAFKVFMSAVIILNEAMFILSVTTDSSSKYLDEPVMVIFLIELSLRIIAKGVVMHKDAFFRNGQDIFDFTLIIVYTVHIIWDMALDISPLRVITLLMYLGDLFEGLHVMITALRQSVKYLLEALMIVLLFSVFFSSVGTSMFQGLFNLRCQPIDGTTIDEWIQCKPECPEGMGCLYSVDTPKVPTSFNNVIYSLGQVLRTITMDDWAYVMFYTMRIYSPWTWIYYLLIIFVGGFFGFNLVIAVLKTHYSEAAIEYEESKNSKVDAKNDLTSRFDVAFLKYIGFYNIIQQYRQMMYSDELQMETHAHAVIHQQPRTLSAIQKILEQQKAKQSYQLSVKNVLLPKFRHLIHQQNQIRIRSYSEDPIEYQILNKLQSYQYSQLQPQANTSVVQEFTSKDDVISTKVQPTQVQVFPKLTIKYREHSSAITANKIICRTTYPLRQHRTLKLIPQQTKSEVSNLSYNIIEQDYYQQSKNTQRGQKFVIYKQNKIYMCIQGFYIDYDEISEKINTKLPKVMVSDQQSNIDKYNSIRNADIENKEIQNSNWSGSNVLLLNDMRFYAMNSIIRAMNKQDGLIYAVNLKGIMQMMRKYSFRLLNNQYMQSLGDLVILINFTFLSLQGIANSEVISQVEDVSTILLSIELGLRLIAYPIHEFLLSWDFKLQGTILTVNIIEYALSPYLSLNEQSLRLMRGTKCIMFYRCLKYNSMAVVIGEIASRTFKQYIYLTVLMFMVILTYALLGMEMYAGVFDQNDVLGQLHSYDDPMKAFATIFNIMTNDDWYGVLVLGTDVNLVFAIIYSYSMVVILNYLTYGLVLAILLDGFGKVLDEQAAKVERNDNMITDVSDEEEIKVYKQTKATLMCQTPPNQKRKLHLLHGLLKSIKSIHKQILNANPGIYDGIKCKQSLYTFTKDNKFRIICSVVVRSKLFDQLLGLALYVSIISFVLTTYEYEEAYWIQLVMNILFCLEFICNIICRGMWMDVGSHLTNIWQIVDIIYSVSYFINEDALPIIIVFHYFGYFRPMRLMYRITWLDKIRAALAQSLFDIGHILITLLSVWIMFGVYGIILYERQFGYCDDKMQFLINYNECQEQNGTWINYKHNFDNITMAIPTLFVVSTFDGWGEVLQIAENSQLSYIGPEPFNSYLHTYAFFIMFCFVGSMFFLSLFTGVLYSNLKINQSKLEITEFTQAQKEFTLISDIILKDHPIFSTPPKSRSRLLASDIVNSHNMQLFMYGLLWIDFIVLMIFHSEMQEHELTSLNNMHHILTIIFMFWVILLFMAFGVNRYFDNYWRRYYVVLSIISCIDITLDYSIGWVEMYYKSTPDDPGYHWLRIFFTLRDLRIILIFQGLLNLQRLMRVLVFALPFLGKIFTILIITVVIFALFGCRLYGHIDKGQVMDDWINFQSFGSALATLFKCASGDDWRTVMTDTMHHNPYCAEDPKYCGSVYNQLYFFLFMLLSNYVLLNLFVLGLIEQFEQFFQLQNSMIQVYIENIDHIKTVWCKYTADSKGKHMKYKYLCKFLLDVGPPLGGNSNDNLWDMGKLCSKLKIQCDSHGFIQYNQLIYEMFRCHFHEQVFKEGTSTQIANIKRHTKEMQLRLLYFRRGQRRTNLSKNLQLKANFNILHEYLNVLIMFKAWENYRRSLKSEISQDEL